MNNLRIDRVLLAAWALWWRDEGNHMTAEWEELFRALQDAKESGDLDHLPLVVT